MSAAAHQVVRVLEGRYVLERLDPAEPAESASPDILATVHGPDGGARMRRDDSAADGWVAL